MKTLIVHAFVFSLCLAHIGHAAPASHVQSVTYNSETITMRLVRQNLRGSNFELWSQNASGAYNVVTPVAERAYLGAVDEYPGAVSFGIFQDDGKFRGGVIFDRGGCWWTLNGAVTRTRGLSQPASFGYPSYTVSAGHGGSTNYGFDVGVDADYQYYSVCGGSNVAKTFEHIEFSLAATRASYMSNALLRPYLARVIIRTDSAKDPCAGLTGVNLLYAVGDEWTNNHSAANRDVVAAVTTSNVGGGFAWMNSIGSKTDGYSANDSEEDGDFSVVWRHELGHNWGLYHYDGGAPEGATFNSDNQYARMSGPELEKALIERDAKLAFLGSEGAFSGVNLPPYASIDGAKLIQLQQSSVTLSVLANDHDANGHTLSISSFEATTAAGGTVARDGQNLVYTPPSTAYLGKDFFKYVVADSSGQTATGVACVSVGPDYRLRLYLPMEDATGTTLTDASGFYNDASFENNDLSASTVTGKYGNAVDFDGSADNATVPGLALTSNTVTLTAWIKPARLQKDYAGILIANSSGAAGLNIQSDRKLRYHWPASTTSWSWDSGLQAPEDSWTFVALVVEPTKATIYMNSGSGFKSAARTATHQAGSLSSLGIGHYPDWGSSRSFDGAIDDVRVYDVSLPQAELQKIYDGGQPQNPVPLDGASGVTTRNLSWVPGANATSNRVYLGANETSVTNATTSDPEYVASTSSSSYKATLLDNTTYYWRVDTVTLSGTTAGEVWTFITGTLPQADTILVNFRRDSGDTFIGGQLIGPTGDDSSNWNSASGASGSTAALVDNLGDATTAGISWSSANMWSNADGGSDEERLAKGYLDDGGSGVSVTLSNIPYANYRVYGLFATDYGSSVVNASVNGSWALGGGSSTTASATISVSQNQSVNGESWTKIVPGSVQGNYWAADATGSTCAIVVRPRNGSSRGTLTAVIVEKLPLPRTPTDLTATGGDSSVSLSWSDTGDYESGFIVQRSTTSGSGFATITTTAANVTSYNDTGLDDGVQYYYRVMATYAVGNSAATSESKATTYTAAQAWRFQHFGTTANSGNAADGFDYDQDGTDNLLEKAFGTDPVASSSAYRPTGGMTKVSGSNHLTITYRRLAGGSGTTGVNYSAQGITYTVEHDADMVGTWATGSVTQVGSATSNGDSSETVTIRLNAIIASQPKYFIRLKVVGAP